MKTGLLAAAAAFAIGMAGSAAQADTFYWSYTLTGGATGSGSGTFTTSGSDLPQVITGATGTIFSDPDLGPGPITVTGLSNYASPDNTLYATGFNNEQFSFDGVSLSLSDGYSINLYFQNGVGGFENSFSNPDNLDSPVYTADYTVSTPETSTWAMMAFGFAGLAFAGYRSRRTAAGA